MFTAIIRTLRIFALFAFAFSPSMLLLVGVGWFTQSAWWFGFIGIPTLLGNGVFILLQPWRGFFEGELRRIAPRPSR